ncbi:hypothetical protein [Pseudoteredinibacter isoporae]|uniref:Uncharacterized protein n=1 Tax=Pseudoteredinibacter isoporae TaxID=570281 RepID=A0A7X0MUI0_9GAMM|nr:hypothetical protein [Pseudoteredinibacter isoporae]MBB6520651.1 hypothetical protein [Pseudoteredinibacter isoporae]NHO86218.1 hypothetical protein [Pseudoteredinibacter isoporae]NIB25331.1 hypothetical protein [Pseudoteredinibacter isoporae]
MPNIRAQRVKQVEIEMYRGIVSHLVVVALGHCCQQHDRAALCLAKDQPDADQGIYDFEFCMGPSRCNCGGESENSLASYRLLRPQTASHTWVGFPQNLRAVRIISEHNTLVKYLADSNMAEAI